MNNKIKAFIPAVLYATLIFFISSIPGPQVPGPAGVDLSPIHIPEFFILSYLIYRALEGNDKTKAIILAILLTTAYGLFDEIHQIFVPGRDFSIFDIIFNFLGSSLILFKLWNRSTFLIRVRGRVIKL